jgi:sigma-B regulation protein RsbU (phosphoserine phosphatase)
MRLFPGIHVPKAKAAARALRRLLRRLTVRGVTLGVEVACLAVTLVILLSGGRAAFFDDVSSRADVVVAAATLAVFVAIHAALRKRIVPALERRFSPAPYDEHTVLLDLGMEARSADSVDALYASIVGRVGNALEAERISIFVHDDATGDYPCRKATAGGEDDDSLALAGTSFVVRRLGKLAAPLDLTPADLEAWSRAFGDAPREVRDARESECRVLKLVGASLLVQIRTRSQLIGILAVGRRRAGHKFSAADREMLMLVAGQLAFVIENSKMLERIMAEERLRRELALAAEVQQRLLPSRPPVSSYLELSGYCQPARGVGGDYYDFIELGGQRLGVAVADVAGKGM